MSLNSAVCFLIGTDKEVCTPPLKKKTNSYHSTKAYIYLYNFFAVSVICNYKDEGGLEWHIEQYADFSLCGFYGALNILL